MTRGRIFGVKASVPTFPYSVSMVNLLLSPGISSKLVRVLVKGFAGAYESYLYEKNVNDD